MDKVFIQVTGDLQMRDDINVLANNELDEVVVKLDIAKMNELYAVLEHPDDMKCVKTGAILKVPDGRISVDVFMYPADVNNLESDHRGYFIPADSLNNMVY